MGLFVHDTFTDPLCLLPLGLEGDLQVRRGCRLQGAHSLMQVADE